MRAAVFCLFLVLPLAVNAQIGCISGKILDTDGNPIPSLNLIALTQDQQYSIELATAPDGSFTINVPAGHYQILTTDETKGKAREQLSELVLAHAEQIQVPEGEACATLVLRKAPRAHLRLRATNLLTEEEINGVAGAFRFGENSVWKEIPENQELSVPPLTQIELQIGSKGFEISETQQIPPLQPGETREITAALRPVQLGCLTGVVSDQQGIPLPKVSLQASRTADHLRFNNDTGLTDEKGNFQFKGLQPGNYFIFTHAESLGYAPGFSQSTGEYSTVAISPGAGCANVSINLGPKAAKLQVTVVDAVSQTPIQDAALSAAGDYGTGNNGSWSLRAGANPMLVPSLKPFQLSAGAAGYQTRTIAISPLQPEETQEIKIILEPNSNKGATSQKLKPSVTVQ
jgi:hypothetical protein